MQCNGIQYYTLQLNIIQCNIVQCNVAQVVAMFIVIIVSMTTFNEWLWSIQFVMSYQPVNIWLSPDFAILLVVWVWRMKIHYIS